MARPERTKAHVDFVTVLGPVYYLVVAAGVALAGGTAQGLEYASILTSTLLSAWAYLVCRSRLIPGASIAFALLVFVLCFAPVALGESSSARTYSMAYTRWGFGLMCILLVESAIPISGTVTGGISAGMSCALLLFLKVNFFVVAVGLVGMSLLLRWDIARMRDIAIGFLIITVPMAAYLRFDIAAMWRDLGMVAAGRGASVSVLRVIGWAEINWAILAITSILAGFLRSIEEGATNRIGKYRYAILCVTVYCAGTLLLSTNYQHAGMPIDLAFALICISRMYPIWKQGRRFRSLASGWLAACASVFIVYSMGNDTMAIAEAGADKFLSVHSRVGPFQSESLAGFLTLGPPDAPPRPVDRQWLAQYVNNGLALLRENTSPGDSIASLDYVNPFSFALTRPPNQGGVVWLAYGQSYSDQSKPDPSKFLGTASVVMIPKWPTSTPAAFEGALRNYGGYVREHFTPVAESKLWILEKARR